jgi:hypothetical protein
MEKVFLRSRSLTSGSPPVAAAKMLSTRTPGRLSVEIKSCTTMNLSTAVSVSFEYQIVRTMHSE